MMRLALFPFSKSFPKLQTDCVLRLQTELTLCKNVLFVQIVLSTVNVDFVPFEIKKKKVGPLVERKPTAVQH